jgi:subtilisin family serine protease
VRVASVKVVDDQGYIYPEATVCGFMWAAAQGMTVTNNSYFVDPWVFTCQSAAGQRVVYQAIARAVDYATAQGVLSVAAAGNSDVDLTSPGQDSSSPDNVGPDSLRRRSLGEDCVQLPSGLRGVVTVSAVGAKGVKAGYSSYGLGAIDLTAPGGDPRQAAGWTGDRCVLSTVPGGYAASCGTSMAAPHVAGVAALLASTHPHATPRQLADLLAEQATPVPCPSDYDLSGTGVQDAYCTGDTTYNSFYGHGMVDALAAVSSGSSATATAPATATADSPRPAIAPAIGNPNATVMRPAFGRTDRSAGRFPDQTAPADPTSAGTPGWSGASATPVGPAGPTGPAPGSVAVPPSTTGSNRLIPPPFQPVLPASPVPAAPTPASGGGFSLFSIW